MEEQKPKRNGGGRPKGSKNKKSIVAQLSVTPVVLPNDYDYVMTQINETQKHIEEKLKIGNPSIDVEF